MGLFNSGKNEKAEKVSKYERQYNGAGKSSHRRSSKHRSQQNDETAGARAVSQPPMMRMGAGYFPPTAMFNPAAVGAMAPALMPQFRYPMPPVDLSKYPTPNAFPSNPYAAGQMNLPPMWNNGMALMNNRSAFQQPLNDFQQGAWSAMPPSNNGYMPPMQY